MELYPKISELKILKSAAGYYIGRVYYYSADDYVPFSRESTYYKTKKRAERELANNTYIEHLN